MKQISLLFLTVLFLVQLQAQSLPDTAFKTYQQTIPGTALQCSMIPIKGGSFKMGSATVDKAAQKQEGPQHTVQLSPFWIGAYEVTYDEFDAYLQDENTTQNSKVDAVTRPSQPYIDLTLGMGKSGGFPANSMQQYGALMYCRWLYQKTGIFYRLPTEAEWEYAARAGATTMYPFGNNIKDLGNFAWYKENSEGKYHKVGEKAPNAWGLYDMLGNVAEWTLDQYDEAYFTKMQDGVIDPLVLPTARHPRTVRGGNYGDDAVALRPAARLQSDPVWNRRDPQIPRSRWWNADAPFVGFRLVRPLKAPSKEEADTFFKTYLGQ
ncbi:MAG TPA: SUMF1/EgtB/PvdO family nonheme iron enzyme [Chitinophagaceae bacterium]|nr:SUMF1/EgtB/PvdO family nonheme iron enzyme [Chitinophagaceae bacterium]